MARKKQTIEVQLTERKHSIDDGQVLVTKLAIGKKTIGFIVLDKKRFYVKVSGERKVAVKSMDEGIEYLIAKYNLQQ
ncbi:MAG: DUF2969 domain-containing protein [Streptococcaceae bacterium]|jgi:hypothetical protein|nr:DUF2969 domain-containing protein [Streptococcaceae bacterium]